MGVLDLFCPVPLQRVAACLNMASKAIH